MLFVLFTIFISIASFANSKLDYVYSMVQNMEGRYMGQYGVINKEVCYFDLKLEDKLSFDADVSLTISRADGRSQSMNLKLMEFEKLADETREAKVLYRLGDFTLIFNQDLTPSVFKYMRSDAVFAWEKLRCRELRRI